jgi:hypothetical protein
MVFSRIGTGKRDRNALENYYYSVMYDLLQKQQDSGTKSMALKRIKAQILRLNNEYYRSVMVDNKECDRFNDEEPSLHHLIQEQKRQQQRTLRTIRDIEGTEHHTSSGILRAFVAYYTRKYDTIPISTVDMQQLLDCEMKTVPDEAHDQLEEPITLEEIYQAIRTVKSNKAPGYDGIAHEFYKTEWETLKTDLLQS